MSDPALLPRLIRLAGPVAIARLGIMGMGVADTIIVGQLAPRELSHLALGWAPTGLFLVGAIGLLVSVQVLGARAIGEGRAAHAGAVLRRGLIIAWIAGGVSAALIALSATPALLALGIKPDLAAAAGKVAMVLGLSIPLHLTFIAASFFMEAISRPNAGAVVMWLGNAVNIALNLVLVSAYGAVGSAWATVGARVFLVAGLLGWIFLKLRDSGFGVAQPAPSSAPGFGAMLAVGAAAAISQVAEAGAFGGMTVIAGRIGEDAVASYQIVLNLLAVVFMIALGFAAATQVLVSESIGADQKAQATRAGWLGLGVNTLAMFAAAVLILLFAQPIGRAFSADPALVAAVAALMPIAALVLAPDGGQVVAAAALRGRGDNWFPTASHVFAYVIVMPPLAFLLGEMQGRGVAGLMEAIFIASCISVGVLVARFAWLTRRAQGGFAQPRET
ncbi:MAG: multidrug resistance protein MATE family [Caulobacteraceae bacterium]|nr:MAG: multidrug resistance protein MATE family [Caulobacteraceae bacterium]